MQAINLIVATDLNGVIGVGADIPWHIPNDFQWFKQCTMGGTLIMGRKTYESIGRPLPGRKTIVLSSDPTLDYNHALVTVVGSLDDAIQLARQNDTSIWVCGGGHVYSQALTRDIIDAIYHTEVNMEVISSTNNVYCHLSPDVLSGYDLVDSKRFDSDPIPHAMRVYHKAY